MKQAMTLVELIFSIIIIATLFIVIPKLLIVSNRSMQFSIKEEALFDAITLSHFLSHLPWDQKTIDTDGSILQADGVECNATTGYRIGGFVGSRNCIGHPNVLPSNAIDGCDDLDDYNDSTCYQDLTIGGHLPYHLHVIVTRDKDKKHVSVEVNASDGRLGRFSSHFFFDSYNLGHLQINRRLWQ